MDNNQKKILIIEDEDVIRDMYRLRLEKDDFIVEVAGDGEEGLEKIKSWKPDLVLLDLIMPKLNGFDLLEIINKDDKLRKVPVLVLSNLGQEDDIRLAKDLNAKDYIIKSDTTLDIVVKKILDCLNE